MVAVVEHAARSPRNAVDRAGEARADRLHAAPERVAIPRLDDQVRVISLQRVVDEAEAGTGAAAREGPLDLADDRHRAQ